MAALRRLAVVLPPEEWFRGWPLFDYYEAYRRALADLGIATIDVPLLAFAQTFDLARNADLIGELKAFKPDAAIALSLGIFLVNCRLPPGPDGWRPNFFTDVLDIPTIAIWDHAPIDFAVHFLDKRTLASPRASRAGALADLRRAFDHRRLIHWSRDSGQTRLMEDLQFASEGRVFREPSPTFPGSESREPPRSAGEGVCFVGYVQQKLSPWSDPALADLARDIVLDWGGRNTPSLWDVQARHIAGLDEAQRRRLALKPDQSFFWGFTDRLIREEAHTARRLRLLGAAGAPVTVYGNLDPAGVPANLVCVPGYIPPGPRLGEAFARHAITIDVSNPAFVDGYGHKPLLCFGSGGFMLVDRKRDFVETFGEVGEAVSYSSEEELAGKVDLYLSRPRLRAELAAAMREKITARHTLHATLERGLAAAADIAARPVGPPPKASSVDALDLLPSLRRWGKWPWHPGRLRRTAAGIEISSDASDWGYAARIALPDRIADMRQPHLRLTLHTRAGRLGVGLYDRPETAPSREQHVGPSAYPVTFAFELPRAPGQQVVLRKTSDVPAHAVVSELVLCDRPA